MTCPLCFETVGNDVYFCPSCGRPAVAGGVASPGRARRAPPGDGAIRSQSWGAGGVTPRGIAAAVVLLTLVTAVTVAGLIRGLMIVDRVARADRRAARPARAFAPPGGPTVGRPGIAPAATPAVVAAETSGVESPELAAGDADGRLARVRPGGYLTLAFPPDRLVYDDNTLAGDVAVHGVAVDAVSYRLDVRPPGGAFVRIDRRTRFGASDMRHHRVGSADAVRITNTGATDVFVDAVGRAGPP